MSRGRHGVSGGIRRDFSRASLDHKVQGVGEPRRGCWGRGGGAERHHRRPRVLCGERDGGFSRENGMERPDGGQAAFCVVSSWPRGNSQRACEAGRAEAVAGGVLCLVCVFISDLSRERGGAAGAGVRKAHALAASGRALAPSRGGLSTGLPRLSLLQRDTADRGSNSPTSARPGAQLSLK